ncbi:unnamed protein product [Soboliphyme baturini]|uniref:RRM domain-containing protein n=1 Tax=Soboliphyme baturini TaxID=241478 RepID=A0A183J7D1_9BILA|nr:unnamed protein product [Soboliphyme baturini]
MCIGRAMFHNADSARLCLTRYNGTSIMGDIVTAFLDTYGRKVKEIYQERIKKRPDDMGDNESKECAESEVITGANSQTGAYPPTGTTAPSTSGVCSPASVSTNGTCSSAAACATVSATIPEDPTTSGLQFSSPFPLSPAMVGLPPLAALPSVILPFASNLPPPTMPTFAAAAAAAASALSWTAARPPNFWPPFVQNRWPVAGTNLAAARCTYNLPPVQPPPTMASIMANMSVPPPGFPVIQPSRNVDKQSCAFSSSVAPHPDISNCQKLRPGFQLASESTSLQGFGCSLFQTANKELLDDNNVVKKSSPSDHEPSTSMNNTKDLTNNQASWKSTSIGQKKIDSHRFRCEVKYPKYDDPQPSGIIGENLGKSQRHGRWSSRRSKRCRRSRARWRDEERRRKIVTDSFRYDVEEDIGHRQKSTECSEIRRHRSPDRRNVGSGVLATGAVAANDFSEGINAVIENSPTLRLNAVEATHGSDDPSASMLAAHGNVRTTSTNFAADSVRCASSTPGIRQTSSPVSSLDSRIQSILKDESCTLVKVVKRLTEIGSATTAHSKSSVVNSSDCIPSCYACDDEMSLSSGDSRPDSANAGKTTSVSSLIEGVAVTPPPPPPPPLPPSVPVPSMYSTPPFDASPCSYNAVPNMMCMQPGAMWSPKTFPAPPAVMPFPVMPISCTSVERLVEMVLFLLLVNKVIYASFCSVAD